MDREKTPETRENGPSRKLVDDGGIKRTGMRHTDANFYTRANLIQYFCLMSLVLFEGTLVTVSAHIITAVIGSGVLSLAWAVAQLGWVAGVAFLLVFSIITYTTSLLLADSYHSPDQPINGKRNYTYMDVVRLHLGNACSGN